MPYVRTTWVDYPATTTAITAARLNNMELGILALEAGTGTGVYTTEAVRDASITSPTEGMRAYITAPTVPAATGEATILPTGIQTIYNGAAWVCVTPVGTTSVTLGTATVTGGPTTTFVVPAGGTNCSVTVSTGTTALVTMTLSSESSDTTNQAVIGLAVTGASTIAPSVAFSGSVLVYGRTNYPFTTTTFAITGLTSGANTFTMQYAESYPTNVGARNMRVGRRSLFIQGIA